MKLMVVESPNKVASIQGYLGDDWKVVASVGHIRDLPQREFGISKPDFSLQYEYIPPQKVGDRTFLALLSAWHGSNARSRKPRSSTSRPIRTARAKRSPGI